MTIESPFFDYYDDDALAHPSPFHIDRKGGEEDPHLGGRLYGPKDPYQVMLQLCGKRFFGVFMNDTFHWNEDVKSLGHVCIVDGEAFVRIRARGGWWDAMYEPVKTRHPHPLLWSYAAPSAPELLYSNTRTWPRLTKLQTEHWLPSDDVVTELALFTSTNT